MRMGTTTTTGVDTVWPRDRMMQWHFILLIYMHIVQPLQPIMQKDYSKTLKFSCYLILVILAVKGKER